MYFSPTGNVLDIACGDGRNAILNKYDVIIINHYRLDPKLYIKLIDCLNTGGDV